MSKRFTEEQIAQALWLVEAGAVAIDVCRKMGVSEQTFYRWKKKYGGMGSEGLGEGSTAASGVSKGSITIRNAHTALLGIEHHSRTWLAGTT